MTQPKPTAEERARKVLLSVVDCTHVDITDELRTAADCEDCWAEVIREAERAARAQGRAEAFEEAAGLDLFPVVLNGAKRTGVDKRLSIHNVRHIVEALREAIRARAQENGDG